jgi:hypothetical protein
LGQKINFIRPGNITHNDADALNTLQRSFALVNLTKAGMQQENAQKQWCENNDFLHAHSLVMHQYGELRGIAEAQTGCWVRVVPATATVHICRFVPK